MAEIFDFLIDRLATPIGEVYLYTLEGPGADPMTRAFNQTPLHLAAGKGYVEIAALLLEHGADIKAGPVSPLEVATKKNQAKMVEFLKTR